MREHSNSLARPCLKAILADAVAALACLDAVRLEELAASCRALQCGPSALELNHGERDVEAIPSQAQSAAREFAAFKGVLLATRANLDVMRRLSGGERMILEYSAVAVDRGTIRKGTDHGDD
jgi:hypothetical protein